MISRLILGGAAALLLLFPAAPAQANHDCTDPKWADHPHCPGGGSGDDQVSGKSMPLVARILPASTFLEQDPSLVEYVHRQDAVIAKTGGESQSNTPGIKVDLKGTGKDPAVVRINAACTNPTLPSGTIGDCALLPDNDGDPSNNDVFDVFRAKLALTTRPYEINCPDPVSGECLDVFTTSNGASAQMAFRVEYYEQILVEIASAIGGADAPNPGRCLSLLSEDDRSAYLNEFCLNPEDCNVTVTAVGTNADGRNNAWDIEANNDTGLICSLLMGEVAVIGVATGLTFTMEADEKP